MAGMMGEVDVGITGGVEVGMTGGVEVGATGGGITEEAAVGLTGYVDDAMPAVEPAVGAGGEMTTSVGCLE